MLPAPRPAVRFATSDKMLLSLQDLARAAPRWLWRALVAKQVSPSIASEGKNMQPYQLRR
jgi:hypothetical protein